MDLSKSSDYANFYSQSNKYPKHNEEDGPGDYPQVDKSDKDLVRRKIRFDDDMQLNLKIGEESAENNQLGIIKSNSDQPNTGKSMKFLGLEKNKDKSNKLKSNTNTHNCVKSTGNNESSDMEIKDLAAVDDMNDSMNLKRLFKSRAKKLIERAESLTSNNFENILGEYTLPKEDEEQKEIKLAKKICDAKIVEMKDAPANKDTREFDVEIGLTNKQNELSADILPSNSKDEEIKEDKKGQIEQEEFKKSREEHSQLCGTKRSRSYNCKEEFERSLKDFTCTIWMDYMVGAKKLQCGHCFCDQCISFWFLREKVWPICREKVRDEKNTECNLIDFTIEHILSRAFHRDSSMLKDLKAWRNRRDKYYKWKQAHKLKNVKIGDKIDVRDTEYIWWTGAVERILKSKYNWADLLYIHYDGWNRCYDEYIPADSERVSPLSLYTTRTDIPKYTRHDGPEDRVYGNVIEGNEAQNENEATNENNNDNNLHENSNNERNQDENNETQAQEDRDDEDENTPGINLNTE